MPRVREEPNLFEALSSMRIFIEDASPTELTPWQLEDQIDTFHRINETGRGRVNRSPTSNAWFSLGNVTNTSLETAVFVDRVLERLEKADLLIRPLAMPQEHADLGFDGHERSRGR